MWIKTDAKNYKCKGQAVQSHHFEILIFPLNLIDFERTYQLLTFVFIHIEDGTCFVNYHECQSNSLFNGSVCSNNINYLRLQVYQWTHGGENLTPLNEVEYLLH